MRKIITLTIIYFSNLLAQDYPCGYKGPKQGSNDLIEVRVNCEIDSNVKFVEEYKNNKQHGLSMSFKRKRNSNAKWWKWNSVNYVDGKENGISIVYDSLGSISTRAYYKNGKPIGKREHFFPTGKLSFSIAYNDTGAEEGPELRWWPNGNKRLVAENKNGQMIYSAEYFPNGQLRLKSLNKYIDENTEEKKVITKETFSPKGKPTGKVVNGNGEVWFFTEESDEKLKRYRVYHEVYKDSLIEVYTEEVGAKMVKKLLK